MLRRGAQPSTSSLNAQEPPTPSSTTSTSTSSPFHLFPRSNSPGITNFLSKPSKWFNRTPSNGRQVTGGIEPRSSTSSYAARKPKISHPTDPRPILPTLKSDSYVNGASRSVLDLSLQRTATGFDDGLSPGSPVSPSRSGLGDLRNISRKGWSRSADDLGKFSSAASPSSSRNRDAVFQNRVEQYRNRSASNGSSVAPSVQSQHPFPISSPLSPPPPQSAPPDGIFPSGSSPTFSPTGSAHIHTRSHSFTPRMPSKLAAPKLPLASSPSRKGSGASEREVETGKEKEKHGPAAQGRGAFPFSFATTNKSNAAPQNHRDPPSELLAPPAIIEPDQAQADVNRANRTSQIVYHSGFINYLSDFSVSACNNGSLNLNKGWKPYKLVLRGTKLYFHKPPSDRIAATSDLFTTTLVPSLDEEPELNLEDGVGKNKEEVKDVKKKRAFWGRRTHPELVHEDGSVVRGTMDALVHEAVFGIVTLGAPVNDDGKGGDVLIQRKALWHDFASSVLLCLPSLAGRAKVENEFVRCCSYLVSGAQDDLKEELRTRVTWLAAEYLRYHGLPEDVDSWEEFRKEVIPNFPPDAVFVGEAATVPTSASLEGLYVPSPQVNSASPNMDGREFSPNLGMFSPRPGQGDRMMSLVEALGIRESVSRTQPELPANPSTDALSKDSAHPKGSPGDKLVWASIERDGLTREALLRLDPHLISLSLFVYHRTALERAPVNLTFQHCIGSNVAIDANTTPRANGSPNIETLSPFNLFFGTDDRPHWLSKLVLSQILVAEGPSRTHPPDSGSPGGRVSEERNPQTSRTHSRSEMISVWAKIGELCRLAGDECSWQAIMAGLCSRAVVRLEKAWKRVDPQALAAVESWACSGEDGESSGIKEPRATPWGGNTKERIKATLEKAMISEREDEWTVEPLLSTKKDFEELRTIFSLCFRKTDIPGKRNEDVHRLVSLWEDFSSGKRLGAGKFIRMDQFMSLSLVAEPRRKGLFEPHFWTRSANTSVPTSHPLVPLLLVEPLPTLSLVDRSQVLRSRTDSGTSNLVIRDSHFYMLLRSENLLRRRSVDGSPQKDLHPNANGRDLGGTIIPVSDGELVLVIQPWNTESTAPSRSSSRAPSRPPSSVVDTTTAEKPARTPSIRVKPASSRGMDRKTSVARRSSLPILSQSTSYVISETSTDPPLYAVVKAGTLDRLVDLLVHDLHGVSVSVADDNGEMPLREGKTRELRVNHAEFTSIWWNVFRSFVTPLVFFELLLKRYVSIRWKGDSPSTTELLRVAQMRLEVIETIKEWMGSGGGTQDLLDDTQLSTSVRTFLDGSHDDMSPHLSAFEDVDVRHAWDNLGTSRKNLLRSFSSQMKRPPTSLVSLSKPLARSTNRDFGKEAPDVDKIDAEELIRNLDAMAAAVFSNVTEEDLFVTSDLLEVQMADRTGWFLPPQFTQPAEEVDIHTIYSHILNCEPSPLIAELMQDALYRLLPPSVRSCIRAFTILHKWLVSKLVAPKLGLRVRQARMNLYLCSIELCRLYSADVNSNSIEQPCIRSFVEATLVSAILSVESRLHHGSWQSVAASRGATCESLISLLTKTSVQPIGWKEPLTVDLGWVLERMLEVISVPDTLTSTHNDSQTLVNFEKRRYLRSIIVNTAAARTRERREVDRRDFDRLNNIEKEVSLLEFDYRAIKEEASRDTLQANTGVTPSRKIYRPFHRHVIVQQEKNKRDKYLRDRLTKEKKLEQQRNDRREEYLNKAMQIRKQAAASQKQHRTKKSMSTAFFQFMRPISSAFSSDSLQSPGVKRSAADLDFVPSQKPTFVLGAVDAQVAHFINNERSYLFRLDTEDGGHYLLQAINRQDMTKWIETINRVSKTAAQRRLTYMGSSPQTQPSDHIHSISMIHAHDPTAVFGVDLEVLLQRDTADGPIEPGTVPSFIQRCLSEIEDRGLTEPGIYRVPGANTDLQTLKAAINRGEWPVTDETDIYAVCDLLKQWFRELPRPVLPSSSYYEIVAAAKLEDLDSKIVLLRNIIQALPSPNFDLMKRMAEHLDKVTDYEDQNHMTAKNLAIVFGPSFLRAPDNDFMTFIGNLGYLHDFVKALIGHFHVIFDEDQEAEAEDEEDDDFDEPILEEDEEEDQDILPSPSVAPELEAPATSSAESVHHDDHTPLHGPS